VDGPRAQRGAMAEQRRGAAATQAGARGVVVLRHEHSDRRGFNECAQPTRGNRANDRWAPCVSFISFFLKKIKNRFSHRKNR
jgi:hypothetical protein